MHWVKKGYAHDVQGAIEANSGVTAKELLTPRRTNSATIEGMDAAVSFIQDAIHNKTPIHIVGDYDADGITSSAILYLLFRHLGGMPYVRLPKRLSEGYGIPEAVVSEIDNGLVITVDNGITCIDAIDELQSKGLTIIIIDHHLPKEKLPEADAIIDPYINPKYAELHSFLHYCGAGLAFKLAEAMTTDSNLLAALSVLAAIGTIADVMPLIGDNRHIVIKGLENMRKHTVTGVNALLDELGLTNPDAQNVSFGIGPVLNAAGRLFDDGAQMSFNLLIEQDYNTACTMAKEMIKINEKRKNIVKDAYLRAEKNIADQCLFGSSMLVVYDPEIPEGIMGILAGKLSEAYRTPTLVFSASSFMPDILKASGRSYGNIHLKNKLDPLSDLFLSYGGHEGAVGLSINKRDFAAVSNAISKLPSDGEPTTDGDTLEYVLEISGNDVLQTYEKLKPFAPFGAGNPMPIFKITNVLLSPRYGSHYKVMGSDMSTVKLYGNRYDILSFGGAGTYVAQGCPREIDVLGTLSESVFRGKSSMQVQAIDCMPVGKQKEESLLSVTLLNISKNFK